MWCGVVSSLAPRTAKPMLLAMTQSSVSCKFLLPDNRYLPLRSCEAVADQDQHIGQRYFFAFVSGFFFASSAVGGGALLLAPFCTCSMWASPVKVT